MPFRLQTRGLFLSIPRIWGSAAGVQGYTFRLCVGSRPNGRRRALLVLGACLSPKEDGPEGGKQPQPGGGSVNRDAGGSAGMFLAALVGTEAQHLS